MYADLWQIVGMKQCTKCKKDKPLTDFKRSKRLKSGYDSWCKNCHYEQRTLKYEMYRKTEKTRELKKYGLTYEEWQNLKIKQNFKCAVCERLEISGNKTSTLHVDHCHKTGKVRQLLCNFCNTVLGKVNDSSELLIKLANYLESHRSKG